jgi:hypothetical protein
MSIDTLVMLADWNLVFKQKMAADQIYRQAWEQTMTLEDHERHLEEIFNQPVSLPSIKISGFTDSGAADSEKGDDSAVQDSGGNTNGLGAIVFEFDISTSGRAVDPELVQADPGAAQATINNARRRLKSSRFRPRYENGVAVDNLNARIRYRFEPDPESIPAEADNAE